LLTRPLRSVPFRVCTIRSDLGIVL
jgi:hypothetical protein